MAVRFGTFSDDVINATDSGDVIITFGGNDLIFAGNGNDLIFSGSGDDTVFAGSGDDVVFGGIGNDQIHGEEGDDLLYGDSGDDVLFGGAGNDLIVGGDGIDTAKFDGSIFDYDIDSWRGATRVQRHDGGTVFETDYLISVEALHFASDDYTLFLDGRNNVVLAQDDADATDEDTAILISAAALLANDVDFDGDTVSLVSVDDNSTGGALIDNLDGTYSYDPSSAFNFLAEGEMATDSFDYIVTDGQGGDATATVMITVAGVNDTPVAADDSGSTDEDTALNAAVSGVLANDSDIDMTDVLTVSEVNGSAGDVGSQVTLASGALLTLNADGSFDYDPNGQFESLAVGQSDTDTFSYTVSDGNGGTDTATVTITIEGAVDPVATLIARDDEFDSGFSLLDFAFFGFGGENVLLFNGNGRDIDVDGEVAAARFEITVLEDGFRPNRVVYEEPADLGLQDTFVDMGSFGTFTTPAFTDPASGLTITGSSDVSLLNLNGVGIVGGFNDNLIDVGETIVFDFGRDISNLNFQFGATSNIDLDQDVGIDAEVTAFDAAGTLIGTETGFDFNLSPGSFEISKLFGGRIEVVAVNGNAGDVGQDALLQTQDGRDVIVRLESDGRFEVQASDFSQFDDPSDTFDRLTLAYTIADLDGNTDTATITLNIGEEPLVAG